jgi:hypothetical protein
MTDLIPEILATLALAFVATVAALHIAHRIEVRAAIRRRFAAIRPADGSKSGCWTYHKGN